MEDGGPRDPAVDVFVCLADGSLFSAPVAGRVGTYFTRICRPDGIHCKEKKEA